MTILQAGFFKSGNLWLYRIIQGLLRANEVPLSSFIQQQPIYAEAQTWRMSFKGQPGVDFLDIEPAGCETHLSTSFRLSIQDIDAYVNQCSHVWSHSPICRRSFTVLPKFDKIVYILRDPRDMALSMSHYVFTPYLLEHYPHYQKDPASFLRYTLDWQLREWVQHVGGYLKHRDTFGLHVVFYEHLLQNFDAELTRLAAYLGLSLDAGMRERIEHEVAFARMKKRNPHHVRRGRSGTWRQAFTEKQHQQVAQIASRMLALLNYPPDQDAPATLPVLPDPLDPQQVEQAIAQSHRSLADEVTRLYAFLISRQPLKAKVHRVRTWTQEKVQGLKDRWARAASV